MTGQRKALIIANDKYEYGGLRDLRAPAWIIGASAFAYYVAAAVPGDTHDLFSARHIIEWAWIAGAILLRIFSVLGITGDQVASMQAGTLAPAPGASTSAQGAVSGD